MSGTMYTDRLYTGQREITGLGIYHYNARFYSPYINRFIQPDTIIPDLSNPQYLNRYSYAVNDPIRYNDPDGHCGGPACVIMVPLTLVALVSIGIAYYSQPSVQAAGREFMSSVSSLVNQVKRGEPSIKHRKVQTDLSTIGKTAGSPNGPMLRGSGNGKWCPGLKGKIFCGTLLLVVASKLLDMPFGDGAIGEDEAVAPGWTPASTTTPTPSVTMTPAPTVTLTVTLTQTPTSTPIPPLTPTQPLPILTPAPLNLNSLPIPY